MLRCAHSRMTGVGTAGGGIGTAATQMPAGDGPAALAKSASIAPVPAV